MSRLESGLFAGRESLITHGLALSTVGDNVANANTIGFKNSRVEFGDVLAESVGSLYGAPLSTGNGVRGLDISTSHRLQGSIEPTSRELDAAIQGNGYFVLNNGVDTSYTRAGNFSIDADGFLVSRSGENVMGFTAESPDTLVPISTIGAEANATASTTMSIAGNLAADTPNDDVPPANPATFQEVNDAATFRTSVEVIDSLGTSQSVALYFFHTGPQNGSWTVQAYVNGDQLGGAAGTPSLVGTTNLTFDGFGLQADGAQPMTINAAWGNGSQASNIAVDLGNMTQLAGSSSVSNVVIDGNPSGEVIGIGYQDDGTIVVRLSNGEEFPLATLGIAMFNSADGLDRVGDNQFRETEESGEALLGVAGAEGRGTISGSSLESSNVDPANEFISMIRFQRGYQAGSQVITTISELMNTTIQIA